MYVPNGGPGAYVSAQQHAHSARPKRVFAGARSDQAELAGRREAVKVASASTVGVSTSCEQPRKKKTAPE